MGNVTYGIPKEMALGLAERCATYIFVETGTFKGETARWAAKHFSRTYTIEGDVRRFQALLEDRTRSVKDDGVHYSLGDSSTLLRSLILQELFDEPTFFWLDAHWTGDPKHPAVDGVECPLVAELQAVNSHRYAHLDVILVDDANFFLHPGRIQNYRDWPTLDQVMRELTRLDRYIFVAQDCICAVPGKFKDKVRDWMVNGG